MKALFTVLFALFLASCPIQAEEKDNRPFSKNIPDAAKWVLSEVPPETTLQVARMPKSGLIHIHFGLGMWIRNNVPVWGNAELMGSVKEGTHPDAVGGMILEQYWKLSRTKLPEEERKRIEFFEATLPKLKGKKPTAKTHQAVLKELNEQIQADWPYDAKFPPYQLKADEDTYFNWKPSEMSGDLNANVETFLGYHRSLPFYDGNFLRVGDPNPKAEQRRCWTTSLKRRARP
ncbi:MAG: hypothetical protein HC904_13720 [Blastochloris sp.]|nr:hypothetical protein [Blastochloris sp.]